MRAGAGSVVITNKLGTHIQGATVGGVAQYVRDDLEASALFLESGGTSIMLVSCDLGGLEPDFTDRTRERMAEVAGMNPRDIIIGATHTGGPSVIPTNYLKPVDHEYLDTLSGKLTELAGLVAVSAAPAAIAIGMGQARIGYNRRCCYADGAHTMMHRKRDAAFTGIEGASDPDQLAIFVRNEAGKIVAVLHQNTCHPCTFYGADFYSADYPGYARRILREAISPDLPVLFFNGAFGDQGQDKQIEPVCRESSDAKLARCGAALAGETLRLLHEACFQGDIPFGHRFHDLALDVKLPDPERLEKAKALLKRVDAGVDIAPMDIAFAHGARLLEKRFGDNPADSVPVHAVRIGDTALVTQPTELFCHFGVEIKRRSPFPLTSVFSICDGYRGYCPTCEAVLGGGYSGLPLYWTRYGHDAGYRIVDTACNLLYELS